jgi:hypothetical protein
MENHNHYQNRSDDKRYFTIVPNFILNHSTAIDQALYLQMKRIAGEDEKICYASEKYFMDKLGVGRKAIKKSLQYLIDHKWIEFAGVRMVEYKNGGKQRVKTYIVKDIWKMNMDYFSKGVSERAPLEEGVFQSKLGGAQKCNQGVSERATKNNIGRITNNSISFKKKDNGTVRGGGLIGLGELVKPTLEEGSPEWVRRYCQ